MRDIVYNPTKVKFKDPIGGLDVNEECSISILINKNFNIFNLRIIIVNDNHELVLDRFLSFFKEEVYENNLYNCYTVSFKIDKPYIYFYHFEFNDCYGRHNIGRDDYLDAVLTDNEPLCYQLNITDKITKKPDFSWYKGKVMYQIMVDRFNRVHDFDWKNVNLKYKYNYILHKNFDEEIIDFPYNGDYHVDFYGGSLKGIEEKLDYLKSLNVGVIYLNPIFLSPTSHKYNTSDYLLIDPMYGTLDDFRSLINKAKEKGISIILDGVFNHTGDDSIYFNKYGHYESLGAYQSSSSVFFKWYDFNNYQKNKDDYRSWWGIKTLPSVNQNSKFVSFISEGSGVINTWMKEGIKGFRLDVVDELNDNFVKKINKAIKSVDKDAIVIGEVWEDATNKISYSKRREYFNGHELDSVMNYPIKDGIIDYIRNNNLNNLIIKIRNEINNYHHNYLHLLMNILGTHDTPRIITVLSNIDFNDRSIDRRNFRLNDIEFNKALKKVLMAYTILYTLPGIPCIYYGDEIGLEGFQDPYSRRPMKFINSKIKDYLEKLGEVRIDNIFTNGLYNEVSWDRNVFIYERSSYNNYKYLIIINNNDCKYNYHVFGKAQDVLNNINYDNSDIEIDNYSSLILKVFG